MSKNILILVWRRLWQEASRGSVLQFSSSKDSSAQFRGIFIIFSSMLCFEYLDFGMIWLSKLVNDWKVYLKRSVKLHFYEHSMKKDLARGSRGEWNVLKFCHRKIAPQSFGGISFSVEYFTLNFLQLEWSDYLKQ